MNTVTYIEFATSSRFDSTAPSGPILVGQPTMIIQFVTKYLLKEHTLKNSPCLIGGVFYAEQHNQISCVHLSDSSFCSPRHLMRCQRDSIRNKLHELKPELYGLY